MRRMYSLKQLQEIVDSEIKALVEGGTLENAKPIYFHGIRIVSESLEARITLTILNNDDTPFTIDTIIPFLKALMDDGARINVNGYVIRVDSTLINAYEIGATSLGYFIYGNSSTERLSISLDDITPTSVADSVNKIN